MSKAANAANHIAECSVTARTVARKERVSRTFPRCDKLLIIGDHRVLLSTVLAQRPVGTIEAAIAVRTGIEQVRAELVAAIRAMASQTIDTGDILRGLFMPGSKGDRVVGE